jgi:hypothetical protein
MILAVGRPVAWPPTSRASRTATFPSPADGRQRAALRFRTDNRAVDPWILERDLLLAVKS